MTERMPTVIAVLPVENMTVDQQLPAILRRAICKEIRAKGYRTVELAYIDEALAHEGLTHAGHLPLFSTQELGEILRADAFLSACLEQGTKQFAFVMNNFVYSCSAKLQDARTGDEIWSGLQKRVAKRRFAVDPINIVIDFLSVEKTENEKAIRALAKQLVKELPEGPVDVRIGDDLLNRAVTVDCFDR